jgi:threonine/homoserine/homoserine lactone efflux protein
VDIAFLLKGLILGFSIAAPVGPIGVLCIRRTLASGFGSGFASGLGAATADASYGAIAAFGLTSISGFLVDQHILMRLVGGAFLLYLGLRTFIASPAESGIASSARGLASAFASILFLTLTNPMTILSFTAVFVGLGLGGSSSVADASFLVLGVLLGSLLWWLILCSGVSLLRSRLDYGLLRWINKLSGAIIMGFGLFTLGSLLVPV